MPEVVLSGCAPEPLLSYLKALGVFRLVAGQEDPAFRPGPLHQLGILDVVQVQGVVPKDLEPLRETAEHAVHGEPRIVDLRGHAHAASFGAHCGSGVGSRPV